MEGNQEGVVQLEGGDWEGYCGRVGRGDEGKIVGEQGGKDPGQFGLIQAACIANETISQHSSYVSPFFWKYGHEPNTNAFTAAL